MKTKSIVALLLLLSFLTACAQSTPTQAYPPGSLPATPTTISVYPGTTEVPQPTATQIPVDLTPAQKAAVQALSKKYNIPNDQIKIISTEAVTWPNGCLGVVIPGVMCTQAIVEGFRIIMEANGQQYEFHTNQDGTSVIDAAQQLATLGFVVLGTNGSITLANPNIPLGPTYNPAFNGFLPTGGSILGTAYVLSLGSLSGAVAVNASGQQNLSFIKNPTYGLAIWRGGEGTSPLLAWGTQPVTSDRSTSLMIANPDGSNLETLLTVTPPTDAPFQLVAELWSADGQSLYFSKEPVGLGGYILFAGASNLYMIDIHTKAVTEIIPQTASTKPQTCLYAISGDYRFVADACTQNVITIRDLQKGTSATIQVPAGANGYRLLGDARFSPTGDRVAFALAKGNPDDERGWVAIGDSTGGTAKLIVTGDAGTYYNIIGWLDDQTLLVQSTTLGNANMGAQLLTVSVDGSNINKVADGSFLAIIDNR